MKINNYKLRKDKKKEWERNYKIDNESEDGSVV